MAVLASRTYGLLAFVALLGAGVMFSSNCATEAVGNSGFGGTGGGSSGGPTTGVNGSNGVNGVGPSTGPGQEVSSTTGTPSSTSSFGSASVGPSTTTGGGSCGDFFCDSSKGETCTSCPEDCGQCGSSAPSASTGGGSCNNNGVCDPGENCITCFFDCINSCLGSGAGGSSGSFGGSSGSFGGSSGSFGGSSGSFGGSSGSFGGSTSTGGTCDHDECTTGDALTPSCDACAGEVCADDPYCCDNAWDDTCVEEAGFDYGYPDCFC